MMETMKTIMELTTELKAKINTSIEAHVAANAAAAKENPTEDEAKEIALLKEAADAATEEQKAFVSVVRKQVNAICNIPSAITDEEFGALITLADLAKIRRTRINWALRHSNQQRWEEYKAKRRGARRRARRLRRKRRRLFRLVDNVLG